MRERTLCDAPKTISPISEEDGEFDHRGESYSEEDRERTEGHRDDRGASSGRPPADGGGGGGGRLRLSRSSPTSEQGRDR